MEFVLGSFQISLFEESQTQIVMSLGESRLEPDDLAEFVCGRVQLTFLLKR